MANNSKHILVLNAGSSSLKLSLFDWESLSQENEKQISWGQGADTDVTGHQEGLHRLLEGVETSQIAAVGHRVVHGGMLYTAPVLLDESVKTGLKKLVELAPLHNAAALSVIEATQKLLPGIPQVATFDTIFHRSLPPAAYLYPVPYEWYTNWQIRRYGFHGLSYTYCSERAAELLDQPLSQLKLIACHLGSGCSLAAIEAGQSLATTMGFTPLEGLMMGSRSGSVDPGILLYLLEHNYLSRDELDYALNHSSGLKGISGSNDFREVVKGWQQGQERNTLAFNMFVERLCQGIAAMVAALGGPGALVFTGGIGEHSAELRQAVVERLAWLGLELDLARNGADPKDENVAAASSKVPILVIHTREELVIARQTQQLLGATKTGL